MAYETRPQYGASSRLYRGAQTAPLQAPPEYREGSYNDNITERNYSHYEQPAYTPPNKYQQQQQHHYGLGKPSIGNTQQQNFHLPQNGHPGSKLQAQVDYSHPTLRSEASSNQRQPDDEYATHGEYHDHRVRQPKHYEPFAKQHMAYQNSSPSTIEDRGTPGGHLRYERRAMPPPRSYSHDDVPRPGQYQSLPGSESNGPTYALANENMVFGNPPFSNQTHTGSNVRSPKSRSSQPKKSSVKERIVIEPSSPETLGWDNPFPTFPTNKKKTPPSDADSTNGNIASMSAKGVPSQEVSQHQRPTTANSKKSSESSRIYEKQLYGGEPQGKLVPQSRLPNGTERGQQKYINQSIMIDKDDGVEPIRYRQQPVQPDNGLHQGQQIQQNGHPLPFDRRFEDLRLAQPSLENLMLVVDQQRSRTLPAENSETMVHSRFLAKGRPEAHKSPSYVVRNYALPHRPFIATNPQYVSHEGPQPGATQQNRNPTSFESHYLSRKKSLEQHGSYCELSDSYPNSLYGSAKPCNYGAHVELHYPLEGMPNFGAVPLGGTGQDYATTTNEESPIQPRLTHHDTVVSPGSSDGRPRIRTRPSEPTTEAHRSRSQPNLRDQRQLASNHNHGFDFANGGQVPPLPQLPAHADYGRSSEPSMDLRYDLRSTSCSGRKTFAPTRQPIGTSASQYELPMTTNQGHDQAHRYASTDPKGTRPQDGIGMYVNQGRRPSTGPKPYDLVGPMPSPINGQPVRSNQIQNPGASAGLNSLNGPTPPPSTRPFNPDTLPEHPAPVRSGLLQFNPNPMAKPPPVRQYDTAPSPVPQKSVVQPSLTASSDKGRERSNPVTHEELERLKQSVRARPDDHGTQLVLAKKMVEAASVLVDEGSCADPKQRNKNREKYVLDAHKLLKKLVNGGYPEAMFYLADCHGRGQLGLEVDPKEAFNLYQSAAKAGHPQSAYRVAVCCEMGQEDGGGTRRDPLKAIQWYKRAATLGDTPAMYKMGMIQLKGLLGQPKNPREAIVWLKRAADRADAENPHALHELGLLFETASGNDNIVKDEAYSRQLFTDAAELGYKFSQFRLGSAYEYGQLGCSIDPRQSIAWYSKAAVQEEHQSELALSGWYLTGSEGVLQQSDTEAYLWARKAAQAGLAKAEYAMGYFTEVGIGAPANIEDAKRWYWRAAAQNYPKARERLEDLRKGGARMQKSRVSRSAVKKGSDGECLVM